MDRTPDCRFALLDESNREEILVFYLGLDDAGRRQRFLGPASEQALRRHVQGFDFERSTVVGLYARRGRRDVLIGVAEAIAARPAPGETGAEPVAELALALAPELRGHGLGSALFWSALSAARERGARRIEVVTAWDNDAMKRLALAAGLRGGIDSRLGDGDWHGAIEVSDDDEHLPSVHWLAANDARFTPSPRAA